MAKTRLTTTSICGSILAIVLLFSNMSAALSANKTINRLDDPMVKMSGAPLEHTEKILKQISVDVCKANDLDKSLITFTWQDINHMVWNGEKTVDAVFVDLYVPGFFTKDRIAVMMESIATAIHQYVGVEKKWVFIHTHFPEQGHIYINGEVMNWDQAAD